MWSNLTSFFSDEMRLRNDATEDPEQFLILVHPRLDQNILLGLSLELHPKTSLISPCHIL